MRTIAAAHVYPLPPSLPSDLQDFLVTPLKTIPSLRPTCSQLLQHPYLKSRDTQPPPPETRFVRGRVALGSGSFGDVTKGLDTHTGALVALKTVRQGSTTDLEPEIKALKAFRHENIVGYLGTLSDGSGGDVIVLEFCAGGSLDGVIRSFGRLPLQACRLYTKQMLSGLHYLHQQRLVHRDFKSANVLLTDDGHCRISDFGTAHLVPHKVSYGFGEGSAVGAQTEGGRTLATTMQGGGAVVGTPLYMAPEVVRRQIGAPADVWALGLTVLEMATGSPPWPGLEHMGPFDVMHHVVSAQKYPIPTSGIPSDLAAFVDRCLHPNSQQRGTCRTLLEDYFVTATVSSIPSS